jgi:hypothetical protein
MVTFHDLSTMISAPNKETEISKFVISVCFLLAEADRVGDRDLAEIFSQSAEKLMQLVKSKPPRGTQAHEEFVQDVKTAIDFIEQCQKLDKENLRLLLKEMTEIESTAVIRH